MRVRAPLLLALLAVAGAAALAWRAARDADGEPAHPPAGAEAHRAVVATSHAEPVVEIDTAAADASAAAATPVRRHALTAERGRPQIGPDRESALRSLVHGYRGAGDPERLAFWSGSPSLSYGSEFAELPPAERAWLVEWLLSLPQDDAVARDLAWAITRAGWTGEEFRQPDLTPLLDAARGDDPVRRRRALHALRGRDVGAVHDDGGALVAALHAATEDPACAVDAIHVLGGVSDPSGTVRGLLHALFERRAGAERAAALRALVGDRERSAWRPHGPIPADAQALVDTALVDPDPEPRVAALEAVARSAPSGTPPPAITDNLRHADRRVALAAIDTVGAIEGAGLGAARALALLAESEDAEIAHQARWSLWSQRRGDLVPVARLVRLRSDAGVLSGQAALLLRCHGERAREALPELVAATRSPHPLDALWSIETLAALLPAEDAAYDAYVAATTHGHHDIEEAAAAALGAFGERAVPVLAANLARPYTGEAFGTALAQACPDPGTSSAVWRALASSKGAARDALAAWLGARCPDDARLGASSSAAGVRPMEK